MLMLKLLSLVVLSGVFLVAGCKKGKEFKVASSLNAKPELFVNLGPSCKVPDGMAADKSGNVYLAVPNFTEYEKWGSKIVKIDKNRKMRDWFSDLPKHKDTGGVYPMGMEFGPDGNLYVADNQYFYDKSYKSRLLRVVLKDGEPTRCDVLVTGFKLANAVRWHKNRVYVSDTYFNLKDKPNSSGVYGFDISEFSGGKTITLQPDAKDSHLVTTFVAQDFGGDGETAGADGVCFDREGNLYCGNFGDGVISRVSFNPDHSVKSQKVVVNHPSLPCCDGIVCDTEKNIIYIADSMTNSIHSYCIENNVLRKVWGNDDDNGAGGLLDQPCEPLLLDNKIIVTNMDFPVPGMKNKVNDDYNTLSVIELND